MRVLDPFVWVYSCFWMLVSPVVCGPYLCMDEFEYAGCRTNVWLSRYAASSVCKAPMVSRSFWCTTRPKAPDGMMTFVRP
jgi:hypothetical protein